MPEPAVVLSSAGLILGTVGAIGLARLTDTPKINADGSISLGFAPAGLNADETRHWNLRRAKRKSWAIPLCYWAIALGFIAQLIALWWPPMLGAGARSAAGTTAALSASDSAKHSGFDLSTAVAVPNPFNQFDCREGQVIRYDRTGRAVCLRSPSRTGAPWETYQDDPLARRGAECTGDQVKVYDADRNEYCVSLERIDHFGGKHP